MDHRFERLPTTLPAYLGVLTRRRRYRGGALPPITASAARARFDSKRLHQYRTLIVAPEDGHLPPFAPQLLAAPLHLRLLADPAFPFGALGLVHVSNHIELLRPIPDEMELGIRTWVAGVQPHRLGHTVTLNTEVHEAGSSATLWAADTVALARGTQPKPSTKKTERDPVKVYDAVELQVPESMGRAYARVAGDLNPIHQRALLAKPFGLPRAIVHGTWTAARAMSEYWPHSSHVPHSFDVRFRAPVFLPSRIRVGRDGHALVVVDAETGTEQVRIDRDVPDGVEA